MSDINVKATFCIYNLRTNFLIFAVLKQWLLHQKETGFSFVFIIFAVLLNKIIIESVGHFFKMVAVRHLAFVGYNFRNTKSTWRYISLCKFSLESLQKFWYYESLHILHIWLENAYSCPTNGVLGIWSTKIAKIGPVDPEIICLREIIKDKEKKERNYGR